MEFLLFSVCFCLAYIGIPWCWLFMARQVDKNECKRSAKIQAQKATRDLENMAMGDEMTDENNGFDEKAANDEGYRRAMDGRKKPTIKAVTNSIWFTAGARYQYEKDRAEIERLRELVREIQSEIDRGKTKDCVGCCNGNDTPEENLCRMCWRIWVNGKMYLLWDWETTEGRIQRAKKEVGS
jgi:hypothetical protein